MHLECNVNISIPWISFNDELLKLFYELPASKVGQHSAKLMYRNEREPSEISNEIGLGREWQFIISVQSRAVKYWHSSTNLGAFTFPLIAARICLKQNYRRVLHRLKYHQMLGLSQRRRRSQFTGFSILIVITFLSSLSHSNKYINQWVDGGEAYKFVFFSFELLI